MRIFHRSVIFFLVSFIFTLTISYANPVSDADSLLRVIEDHPHDSTLFQDLSNSIYQNMYNDTYEARGHAKQGLELAMKQGKYGMAARMYMFIGITYDLLGHYDSAFMKYDEGIALTNQYKLTNVRCDLYNNYSITLAVVGRINESVEYALKALEIAELSGDSTRLAKIFNNLGARYSDMEQGNKAREYYLKASEINKARNDNYRLAHNYGNIGLLYYTQMEDEKALEYFLLSLALQDTLHNKMDYSIALHNLALAYNRLGDYEVALDHENRALKLSTLLNDGLGIIASLNGLAAISHEMGFPEKSLEYLNQSEKDALEVGARYYLIEIYQKKATLYAEVQDYKNAFLYNQKYGELKDSILTVEKDQAMGKIDQYENEKQEKEIQFLTLDSKLQKANIKRQKVLRNSISIVGILILLLSIGLLHRYRYVRKTRNELAKKNKVIHEEKERSDELLLNILPEETAEELKAKGSSKARHFDMVSVMFTDFKGFTSMAEKMSAQELVDEIDTCFKNFDEIISKYRIEKIKTIGDAYMCAGGLPVANTTNPEDVVQAALEIQEFMETLKIQRQKENRPFFELRLGIHTGPVIAGIVGTKKFQYDIWGDTVNIASRMESSGEVGKVNISLYTYEKIKNKFDCIHRGKITAKGKGEIDMYFVNGKAIDSPTGS